MTTPYLTTPYYRRMHPLMVITAVSLTVFSLLGIAAITGVITPARSERSETVQVASPISAADAQKLEDQDKAASAAAGKESTRTDATGTPNTGRHATDNKSAANLANPTSTADVHTKACTHCGQVAAIKLVKQDGEATGLGAVAGGVAGGVVGNQIGKGKGNILMTILGAGGGAYAGHTIEKKVKATTTYVVKVHMNDGSTRTVTMADKPDFTVGDQVKVINGGLSVIS